MAALRIVIMGVSGCGKSTVGSLLAHALELDFIDADDLHSASNKKKMAAGIPLDDVDRAHWLDSACANLERGGVVLACSALRRCYRDRLRRFAPQFRLIYLYGTPDLLAKRLGARLHEFMAVSLLDSQLATLEPPDADECPIALDIKSSPDVLVECAVTQVLRRTG